MLEARNPHILLIYFFFYRLMYASLFVELTNPQLRREVYSSFLSREFGWIFTFVPLSIALSTASMIY